MSAVLQQQPFEVTYPVRIPWRLILADLRAVRTIAFPHGISGYRLAVMLNVERSTVQRWENLSDQGDIGYGYGRALLSLHHSTCGWERTLQRITQAEPHA